MGANESKSSASKKSSSSNSDGSSRKQSANNNAAARRSDSTVIQNGGTVARVRAARSASGDSATANLNVADGPPAAVDQLVDPVRPRKAYSTGSAAAGIGKLRMMSTSTDSQYSGQGKRRSKELGSIDSQTSVSDDIMKQSTTSGEQQPTSTTYTSAASTKLNRKQSQLSQRGGGGGGEAGQAQGQEDGKYGKKQRAPPHPLAQTSRDIIRCCFDEPHADLGNRIQMRVMEKRPDYREFLINVGREQWPILGDTLTQFLDAVVAKIENIDEVCRMSREFGEMHVGWKSVGFKPDFWVSIADTMTTECMYLDQAMHGQTEDLKVLEAWSGLVGIVLSNVRDGYYERLRRERRTNRKNTTHKLSATVSVDTNSSGEAAAAGLGLGTVHETSGSGSGSGGPTTAAAAAVSAVAGNAAGAIQSRRASEGTSSRRS